jgi:hypothetical protein
MIINIDINYKNYNKKVIENFNWFKNPCPKCKAYQYLIRYGKYNRRLCVIENDEFKEIKMDIQRVLCKFCDCTHAILPIEVVPYCYYSQMCVLEILKRYYLEEDTIEEITENYDITQLLIYLLVAKFIKFSKYIVDFLRIYLNIDVNYESSPEKLLELILSSLNSYSIIKPFFNHSKKIFLMTRSQNALSKKIYIGVYD